MHGPYGFPQKRYLGIFSIFIFWPQKMVLNVKFWPNLTKNGQNWPKFDIWGHFWGPRNENWKNSKITFLREPIGTMHTKFGPTWGKTAEFYRLFSYLAMKNMIFKLVYNWYTILICS